MLTIKHLKDREAPYLKGFPLKGDISLLLKSQSFLRASWSGPVERVFSQQLVLGSDLHLSWYETVDKGGTGLFGVNSEGRVICGLVYDPHTEEMSVEPASEADPWK